MFQCYYFADISDLYYVFSNQKKLKFASLNKRTKTVFEQVRNGDFGFFFKKAFYTTRASIEDDYVDA